MSVTRPCLSAKDRCYVLAAMYLAQTLRRAVEWPLRYRETFIRLGLRPPRGILLYGPPGCSKTTMVKALAGTAGATFLSLNVASVYSAYVGEAERAGTRGPTVTW